MRRRWWVARSRPGFGRRRAARAIGHERCAGRLAPPRRANDAFEVGAAQAMLIPLEERASPARAELLAHRRDLRPATKHAGDALPRRGIPVVGGVNDDATSRVPNRVRGLALLWTDVQNWPRRRHGAIELTRYRHAHERLPQRDEMDMRDRERVSQQLAREIILIGHVGQPLSLRERFHLAPPRPAADEQEVNALIITDLAHRLEDRAEIVNNPGVPGIHDDESIVEAETLGQWIGATPRRNVSAAAPDVDRVRPRVAHALSSDSLPHVRPEIDDEARGAARGAVAPGEDPRHQRALV